jgi:hypothetical protein
MWEFKFGKIKKNLHECFKAKYVRKFTMKRRIQKYKKLSKKKSLYYQYKEWCEINYLNQ